MVSKLKARAIGRVLVVASKIDSVRGENLKLQKILGKALYYQKGNKWFYNIEKMNRKTILELNKLAEKIERT